MSENIELRSEKVRNIIGQIPSRLIRVGISVIFFIVVGFITGSYFFEYEYTIETTATLEQRNDTTLVQIIVPANEKNRVKRGHKVILSFDNIQNLYGKKVETQIQGISNALQIKDNKGFYVLSIVISDKLKTTGNETIVVKNKTELKAQILTDKERFFDRIVSPVRNVVEFRE
jgi:hypothetical protein